MMQILLFCLLIGTCQGLPDDRDTLYRQEDLSRPVTAAVQDVIHEFVDEFDSSKDEHAVHW